MLFSHFEPVQSFCYFYLFIFFWCVNIFFFRWAIIGEFHAFPFTSTSKHHQSMLSMTKLRLGIYCKNNLIMSSYRYSFSVFILNFCVYASQFTVVSWCFQVVRICPLWIKHINMNKYVKMWFITEVVCKTFRESKDNERYRSTNALVRRKLYEL